MSLDNLGLYLRNFEIFNEVRKVDQVPQVIAPREECLPAGNAANIAAETILGTEALVLVKVVDHLKFC